MHNRNSISVVTLIFCVMSCSCNEQPRMYVEYDTIGLRSGDIVFRNGYGYESRFVTEVSYGDFSHVGITFFDGNKWCVIHAVPGETINNEPEYLKCESIAEFYRYDRAKSGACARVSCNDSLASKAAALAFIISNNGVLFDNKYDKNDTTKFYCTELVDFVFKKQNIDLVEDRCHEIPLIKSKVIFPIDIWDSPLLEMKQQFKTVYKSIN